MKQLRTCLPIAFCLSSVLGASPARAQVPSSKVFLLEDADNKQWCAYNAESTATTAVQQLGAMTVATLTYSNEHLVQIDVSATDQSGDWMAYDRYSLDGDGHIVKLSRLINVLPGDRSVVQTFSISDGKATKTGTSEKELSTGQLLTSPKPVWLPTLTIETAVKLFAFSALLDRPDLRTSTRLCATTTGKQRRDLMRSTDSGLRGMVASQRAA